MQYDQRTEAWLWTQGRAETFTVEDARRLLPYLSRIVSDAQSAYHNAKRLRTLLKVVTDRVRRTELLTDLTAFLRRLDAATDECNAVGATIVDLSRGTVAIPARTDDHRPVTLIWRIGEPMTMPWIEVDSVTVTLRPASSVASVDALNDTVPPPQPPDSDPATCCLRK